MTKTINTLSAVFVYCLSTIEPARTDYINPMICDPIKPVVPNLFGVHGTLTRKCKYLAAPQDGLIGLKIKELKLFEAPLTPVYGTLVCRGTPVENH